MDSLTAQPLQNPTIDSDSSPNASPPPKISTAAIVNTMLLVSKQISDLIFSPGRMPQVELNGQLREVNIAGVGKMMPEATRHIATDLIGSNALVADKRKRVRFPHK